ncbi:translesion DNA synthesis-associated protein ImuA [Candidatus Rariloculus sp.]|uniref:translesion DNA synthesis-associated protein ImuA n=1 Tax=Candidatus Rariloculus sp. TaxID=3101265 RepID=UPI003D1478CE
MSVEDLILHPRIWLGRGGQSACKTLPTGFDELDRYLPGGGWPQDALTEIVLDRYGIGELSLLIPALALLSSKTHNAGYWIVWIDPPFIPYAPALTRCGVNLDQVLLVHSSGTGNNVLWAVEQALRSGSCVAILAWLESADDNALRRLQLGAEERACWTVLFRPVSALRCSSPAALRLRLSPADAVIRVEIVKCRGARPGMVVLERPA